MVKLNRCQKGDGVLETYGLSAGSSEVRVPHSPRMHSAGLIQFDVLTIRILVTR
jgi:hypothetical protein